MTKEQAKEALKQGQKIQHEYFGKEEYIYLISGVEYFEDGIKVPLDWWKETEEWPAGEWLIFKEGYLNK